MWKLNEKKKKIINLEIKIHLKQHFLLFGIHIHLFSVTFNTFELFCLQIQFYSIPLYILYTSLESVHGMDRLFRMYSVVRCISVYICNRQDKGKCCIVLSFISLLLFSLFCAFFYLFITCV